ncbi:MAG: L,D-transpeptidase [Proteobacteria bacterium]|nr:L,D-transpeptidase [Pseudomonadota bacterium]
MFYSTNGPSYFIVVEKKYQKLKLFEQKDSLRMIKEFTCATGENPGTKKTSGDARTPEGIYHITEIYEDKRITVFGSRAFHLDYPNIFDAHAGRLGDGIFIHGTNKKLNPNSTNGCITLNNSDLDEIAPYLAVNTTPIIVLDTQSELMLEDSLHLEKNSSRFNDLLENLALNPETTPVENIKNLTYLRRGEQVIISASYKIFEDKLTQYNEHKRAYLAKTPTGNWRTLYAVQNQAPPPTILALHPTKTESTKKIGDLPGKIKDLEVKIGNTTQKSNPPLEADSQPVTKTSTLVAKSEIPGTKTSRPTNIKPPLDKNEELHAFVEKWRTAWANKDIDTYINCYSPSFKSGNLNREGWRAKKSYLNKKYSFITISIRNIAIEWTSNGANVTFQQTYKSDQLQNRCTKTLQLVNKKNRWMIENEHI